MKKKFLLMLAFSFLLTQGLFAQNNQRGGPNSSQNNENMTEVTAQGTVTLTNRRFAELQTANGMVYLMIPHHVLYNIPIKDGDDITVKGHQTVWNDKNVIRASVITVGSDNYVVGRGRGSNNDGPGRGGWGCHGGW
jgi:hypothetical protein